MENDAGRDAEIVLRFAVRCGFLEEGTSAAWLYDLLKPHVTKLLVCDPRKNASMREGNQSDKIEARRLAELLRLNHLNPVRHGEHGR